MKANLCCGYLVLLALLGPRAAEAYEKILSVADPGGTAHPPGLRGILELQGRHLHTAGNINLNVTNLGLLGSMPGSELPFDGVASAQWPAGSGTEYLWGAALWVGAEKDGQRQVSAWENDQGRLFFEFLPGLSDLDRIYESRELAPGGMRGPLPQADDDRDGRIDEDRLDGRDNDHDGRIDEDYAGMSSQMFACTYRDDHPRLPLQSPDHHPLGIEVQQTSMAWEGGDVGNFVGLHFRITNVGQTVLANAYVGLYADFDVGPRLAPSRDDLAGYWEGVGGVQYGDELKRGKLQIGYMFDADGDNERTNGSVGILFLGALDAAGRRLEDVRNFQMYTQSTGSANIGGTPRTDEDRYDILDGSAHGAIEPPESTPGLRQESRAKLPDDYRIVISVGPFAWIPPGASVEAHFALVIGQGFEGMVRSALRAYRTFQGGWMDCDGDPSTGVQGRETRICADAPMQVVFDPCDPNCRPGLPECGQRLQEGECTWINADCTEEAQTEIRTGVGGRECHVPWLTSMPPTPPRLRVVTAENRVDILWDNRSETTRDFLRGQQDFEAYRIWRADNWTRPLGTDERTGPPVRLWMVLAEFDLVNGVGADTGLHSIRYRPNLPDGLIDYVRDWRETYPGLPLPELPGTTAAQVDTAASLLDGVRYYRFTDPPLVPDGRIAGPCPSDGSCPPVWAGDHLRQTRCNDQRQCQETYPTPHAGAHYFYSVTTVDHRFDPTGRPGATGEWGRPNANFVYVSPPTASLPIDAAGQASYEIHVVPNPATRESMKGWQLDPNNDDPTGIKIEFHHLPKAQGKIKIWTLAGDLVETIAFDGSLGNGTANWNLLSRNGQEVTSGIYLYTVEANAAGFKRVAGKFVVIL